MKEQQLAKGINRPANDVNLILAASHGNQPSEAQNSKNRFSPPGRAIVKPGQNPMSVSQDRPISKRGPVEDPFFPDSTHSNNIPSKTYNPGQKSNTGLMGQTPSK